MKSNLKLQHVLIIPFILLITLSVLMTGYWAWRYSEQSTLDLGQQISKQSTIRVEEHLKDYLSHAYSANIAVKQVITNNLIDKNDKATLHDYLQDIVHDNRKFGTLGFGYPDGAYIGSGLSEAGKLQKKIAGIETGRVFYTYELIRLSNPVSVTADKKIGDKAFTTDYTEKKINERPNYDARVRPWFVEAKASNKPVWSSVYEMFSTKKLGMTLSEAVYNKQGEFAGIVGTDVVFRDLDRRLNELRLTQNSLIFILDNENHVIAQNVITNHSDSLLYKVADSGNPLLVKAIDYLDKHYDNTKKPILTSAKLVVDNSSKNYFINYVPYAHEDGLDWHIAVVIPESDFLTKIERIKSHTLLIWLFSFLLSLLLGLFITYFVARSIKRLQYRIRNLSYGGQKFQHINSRIKEVDDLSQSFSEMSKRLQDTFIAIKQSNEQLEEMVSERTSALKKANDELYKLSQTDNLTQLANRRSFQESLTIFSNKLLKKEIDDLAVIMCDLDCFKEYNDTYGHQKGDDCLQHVANIIKNSIRNTDMAGRYGGEEFIIVMPGANILSAERVAINIMQLLKVANIPHKKSNVSNRVTMSMGITVVSSDDITSKDALISKADKALYDAKKQGRNRYVIDLNHKK